MSGLIILDLNPNGHIFQPLLLRNFCAFKTGDYEDSFCQGCGCRQINCGNIDEKRSKALVVDRASYITENIRKNVANKRKRVFEFRDNKDIYTNKTSSEFKRHQFFVAQMFFLDREYFFSSLTTRCFNLHFMGHMLWERSENRSKGVPKDLPELITPWLTFFVSAHIFYLAYFIFFGTNYF